MILRSLAKDTVLYGGADAATKAVALVVVPIIASVLSPASFGTIELIRTAVGLAGLFIGAGLNNAVQRFYWDPDTKIEEQPTIVSSGLGLQFATGTLVLSIGVTFAVWAGYDALRSVVLSEELAPLAILFALVFMVFNQWITFLLDVLRLHMAPLRYLLVLTSQRIGALLLTVVAVVVLGMGVTGYFGAHAAASVLLLAPAVLFARRDLAMAFDPRWGKKLFSFGFPFVFVGIAHWLFGSMDRWMLAHMATLEEAGVYSVAFRFATVVLFASTAFGRAWSPVAMKIRRENPEEYRRIYADLLLMLFAGMLVVAGTVAVLSGEVIGILMPEEYSLSAIPLCILAFGLLLHSTQQITAIGISIERRTALFARLSWITAIVNLVLNWLLIRRMGAVGAALATTISYAVLTGAYLYFTQRYHPLPIEWRRLSGLIVVAVTVAVLSVVLNSTDWRWPFVLSKLAILTLSATGMWWLLPMGRLSGLARKSPR